MIIYNVTTKVAWHIYEKWLEWMKNVHIPAMLSTELFTGYRIVRLLDVEENDGPTVAVQYFSATYDDYRKYVDKHSESLSKTTRELWADNVIAFRSVMEVIN